MVVLSSLYRTWQEGWSDGARAALVVRNTGLGDLMTSLPALRAVRRALPAHRLGTTCPSWLVPLARVLDVAEFYVCEDADAGVDVARHQDVDASMLRAVMSGPYCAPDVVVALRVPNEERTAGLAQLAAGSLIAFRDEMVGVTAEFPSFDDQEHIVRRWSRLLGAFGISSRSSDLYPEVSLSTDRPNQTVIHVGAGSPARQWPTERWAEVARRFADDGHDIVFTGSTSEASLVERTRRLAGLGPSTALAGACSSIELAALVQHARLVLSTDTGVSHLATAFRRPSVTLFGPTSPALWGPPRSDVHQTVWAGSCGDPYGSEPFQGLLDVTTPVVIAAASSALLA